MRRPFVALLFLAASAATAAEAPPAPVAAHLNAIFEASKAHAMVAAIVDGERTFFLGKNAGEGSLVRINSLTKVMTGEVLANLIAEGRVRLDDPLQLHARRGRSVPRAKGARAITLRDLTAHVSGLPRDLPPGLSQSDRWQWLARRKIQRAPGHVAEYSNAAYMFLGDALSAAASASYEALLKRTVIGPLALADTTLNPTAEQCARLLPATHACAPTYELDAMGGLYSTPRDMTRWMQAQLASPAATPRAAAHAPIVERHTLARVANLDMAGRMDAIAMGWLRMRLGNTQVLQKTGGGGGFMNYVILAPAEHKGLFITVNRSDIEMLRNLTAQANALMAEDLLAHH